MTAHLYAVLEPLLVGAVVLLALAAALRRFVPHRRKAGAGAGCSSCSGCGGCGSAPSAEPRRVAVLRRRPLQSGRGPGAMST
ncbi:MAG TPA: FeoB-associated Cys-rich membrane protein [Ideonella sp.]|nr:FeoB-associated Cys-rich membrane protein [Ideonella sp.]